LYAQAEDAQAAKQYLLNTMPNVLCSLELLEDKEWEKAWMDDFKPQKFGDRLWVCPTWLTPPEPEAVNLMLDPGLAFGTGTHPTTSLCLTWLEQSNVSGKTILDYGCGSGILSIAALKLGAEKAYAVDIDPQALQATYNNAQTNHILASQLLISAPETVCITADILIANILLAPLTKLKDRFYQLLDKDALLIVSGILNEQEPVLIETYLFAFTLCETKRLNGWSLLVFKRL
jgi:ribosomal protein L11 methyltransferase